MALTVTDPIGYPLPIGDRFLTVREVVPDSAWVAAGEALTHEQLGFSKAPDWVEVQPTGGFVAEYDIANEVLLVYWVDTTVDGAAMAAVPDATDLDAFTFVVKSYGRFAG